MADLFLAKKKLSEALEARETEYWELMKKWYRGKISKDDFDVKARHLLGVEIGLHNDFLFALLIKCQSGVSEVSASITKGEEHAVYMPGKAQVIVQMEKTHTDFIPMPFNRDKLPVADPLPSDLHLVRCSSNYLLPNHNVLHARMLLDAWEVGLESVTPDAAKLMCTAIEHHLKNVLTCIVSHRTTWQSRNDHFRHSYGRGCPPSTSLLRTSQYSRVDPLKPESLEHLRRRVEGEEVSASLHSERQTPEPISLFEVKDCLQNNRNIIPSHTVYAMLMERIATLLWHPSSEEIQAKLTLEKWEKSYSEKNKRKQ